jgi:predicted heme/steroid binding protein
MNLQAYNPYFFTQFPIESISFIDKAEPTSKRDLLQSSKDNGPSQSKDYIYEPFIINIEEATKSNIRNYQIDLRSPNPNKVFTLSELAQYDGTKGNPAYVAVNGIVYDVSDISTWSGGTHYGIAAGKDLTTQFETCHGVPSKVSKLPIVGILKG